MGLKLLRFCIVGLPLVVLVALHADLVPVWDGFYYYKCIDDHNPTNFEDFWGLHCVGHPSALYFYPLATVYHAFGGSLGSVYATNVVLGLIAVASFLAVLDTLYPESSKLERTLTAATVASLPPFAASALNINPDYGVFVFFLILLGSLVTGRGHLAGLSSAMLVLSKEMGIVLWAIAVGAFLLSAILRRDGTLGEKAKKTLKQWPVLAGPVVFAWYVYIRLERHEPIFWDSAEKTGGPLIEQLTSFALLSKHFKSYLAGIFTINFTWAPTIFMVWGACAWGLGKVLGAPARDNPMRREFIVLLFLLSFYVLTRHATFLNLRYLMVLLPLIILASFHAMQYLVPSRRFRVACVSLILFLTMTSAFRTWDPISKRIFGTFRFGKHEMLKMTSITGECCGFGRDQLVYNLEFVQYHRILNDILADIRPTMQEPLSFPAITEYLVFVSPTSPMRRAGIPKGAESAPVQFYNTMSAAASRPEKMAWITLPYYEDRAEHSAVKNYYKVVEERKYRRGGYYLNVEMLALK